MTKSHKLKSLKQSLHRLKLPNVNNSDPNSLEINKRYNVNTLTSSELVEIISNNKNYIFEGYDDEVSIVISCKEDEETIQRRIKNYNDEVREYEIRKVSIENEIENETKRIENEKLINNVKYKDHDYILFLKLKNKMIEKGFITE